MIDYSQYFADGNTPLPNPNLTIDDSFDIISYRNEQFDVIKATMPHLTDAFSFFTELERRVKLKELEYRKG